jgi:carbonic anhydrase
MESKDINIGTAKDSRDFLEAKEIILEYAGRLGIDLCFQNFDYEINNLQEMYSEPTGALILATVNNKTIGIAGIRKFENNDCELKRMYVKEEFRGSGFGRQILEYAIELAKNLNYDKIKLDTHESMEAAIKLYVKYGFREIPQYRYNPNEAVRFFELDLKD